MNQKFAVLKIKSNSGRKRDTRHEQTATASSSHLLTSCLSKHHSSSCPCQSSESFLSCQLPFNFQFGVLWQGKKIEDREHHVHKHYSQPEDWNQTWWDCRFANDEKMFLFCFVPFSFSIKDLLYRPFFGKTRQMWLLLNLASVKELAQDCSVFPKSRWRFEDAYENGLLFQNTSSSTHTHTTRHWHINPADFRYGLLKQLVTTGLLS